MKLWVCLVVLSLWLTRWLVGVDRLLVFGAWWLTGVDGWWLAVDVQCLVVGWG